LTKTAEAFRTISEVADELEVPKHVLRFWEGRFPQIRPMKRGGGRRYYRPEDLALLRGICRLLHAEGYTIKGVQKILREQGIDQVKQLGTEPAVPAPAEAPAKKSSRIERPRAAFATQAASSVAPAGASSRRSPAAARGTRDRILAAIAELEACRGILLGKAPESSARRHPAKQRRAARP
jgi:DNA-binding transcriptional MerR regulator